MNKSLLQVEIQQALIQLKSGSTEYHVAQLISDAIDRFVRSATVVVDVKSGMGQLD